MLRFLFTCCLLMGSVSIVVWLLFLGDTSAFPGSSAYSIGVIKVSLGMYLMTGMLAFLNALVGKWGPALAMLGLSLASFAACLVLGGSYLTIIPGVLLVVAIGSFCFGRQQRDTPEMGGQDDSRLVSERMLAEMDRNIAARKANRG